MFQIKRLNSAGSVLCLDTKGNTFLLMYVNWFSLKDSKPQ